MYRVVVLCALATAAAWATENGSVVSSFRSPCTNGVYGIDYHGGHLFHADAGAAGVIYETTTTGSLVRTIPVGPVVAATGIDRTDIEFWTCRATGVVYRLSTAGSYINSFQGPSGGADITYAEGCLWYTAHPYIYRLAVNGSIMGSFPAPPRAARGICADPPHLWVADVATGYGALYEITTGGVFVRSIPQPGHRPWGVTWDGYYLWYTDYQNDWVYRITVAMTDVVPASLGRARAAYY
jgi:hypothetical protein